MKTRFAIRGSTLLVAAFVALGVATAASCSSSSGTTGGTGGTGGTQIVGPSSSSSMSTTTTTGTGTTTTGTTGTGGATSTSSSGNPCVDTDAGNCYSCAPMTNDQLLNACNGQVCAPYDNGPGHLPMLTADGGLPPITM